MDEHKKDNGLGYFGCFMIALIFFIVTLAIVAISNYLDAHKGTGYVLSILIFIAAIWYSNKSE